MVNQNNPPHFDEQSNVKKIFDITQHLHILILRKSAGKLLEFVNAHSSRKYGSNKIINIKYELSKCRPEVLNIFLAMAKDPKRFEIEMTYTEKRIAFKDTVNSTRFRAHCWGKNLYQVTINGENFLTNNEMEIMWKIASSLDIMRKNEYKLEKELKSLEKQNNVFEIYKNEKL
jgi:hypothetical protein